MRTFYRNHEIEVNAVPSGTINFDIYLRNRSQHLVSGFTLTDSNEQTVLEKIRTRVDELISDFATNGPPKAPPLIAAWR